MFFIFVINLIKINMSRNPRQNPQSVIQNIKLGARPSYKPTTGNLGSVLSIGTVPMAVLSKTQRSDALPKKQRSEMLQEIAQKQEDLPLLTIVKSSISLYSWKEMQEISVLRLTNGTFNTQDRGSAKGGVNDERMGNVSLNIACEYCHQIDCPGHYGLIDFGGGSIYNPAYIREVVQILSCVCNSCGQLLITRELMEEKGFLRLSYDKRLAKMEEYCKDLLCIKSKGPLKGGPIEDCAKNPVFVVTAELKETGVITYKTPQNGRKPTKDDKIETLSIEKVYTILDKISVDDAVLLGFPNGSHPRNLIMKGILVIPIIARPPVTEGGVIHYDQITHMYSTIFRNADKLKQGEPGAQKELYTSVKQLIFKTEGKKLGTREFLSIVERIQGKTALLRGLLMGKRVNYCGRTVAGPDPSLRYGQIRIPQSWAKILTKPIKVTDYNIHNLTALLEAGKITHIKLKRTGLRKYYDPERRERLQIGDVVERWLQDGDRIINNRQPTLHRQSMMAYEIVLGYQLTIGLHLSYTTPMNCDFDGDENNVWAPQDFEVEAEADILMNVVENIMSSEQNKPIMGLVQNSITGAWLLSDENTTVDDDLFAELMSLITNQDTLQTLYARLIKYGIHPRSGKAVFSAMLPEDFYYNNAGVEIYEGILISGQLTKSHVGASHRSIIQDLYKKYGSHRTADFFSDGPWVINKWLVERGFSVGLKDCISLGVNEYGVEYDRAKAVISKELANVYVKLESLGPEVSDPIENMYREKQINQISEVPRGIGLRLAKDILAKNNSLGVMTDLKAGAKGNLSNIGNLVGLVGQQFIHGQRLKATLTGGTRLLPTYDKNSLNPEAHGFIPVSYYQGMGPEALFFLQSGGREGLLDTALKTAETGTISRRLVKSFESTLIFNDMSIRNVGGTLFAPSYNNGYDIAEMLSVKTLNKPNFTSFIDLQATILELNAKRGWVPKSVADKVKENRDKLTIDLQAKLLELNAKRLLVPKNVADTVIENIETLENVLPIPKDEVKGPQIQNATVTYNLKEEVMRETLHVKITKYEKARLIGARAVQLGNNAPPLLEIGDELDPVKIAKMEFYAGLLQIYVIRRHANGETEIVYPTLENI